MSLKYTIPIVIWDRKGSRDSGHTKEAREIYTYLVYRTFPLLPRIMVSAVAKVLPIDHPTIFRWNRPLISVSCIHTLPVLR
ncbi:hypothetical protein AB9K32_01775 [Allomuricauda sp. XS_ASV26]|uniref:hypothetical protein n=1 Tax=Allomuricauda sp. XS_ASV26 TaxID=3241292 RepID=UPI00351519CB